jgi:ABC-type dipeptide/oligopeptide/nickel transport system permease subunit
LTEGVDPEWSHAAEERLTAIWEDNVKGISNDFVFVMCKTTLCQVNYRFPTGTDDVGRDRPFSLFLKGFRVSELASELHVGCISYSGIVVAVEFERNFPQAGPQPTEQSRRPCRSLDKPGP